jgi:hypothetical protein
MKKNLLILFTTILIIGVFIISNNVISKTKNRCISPPYKLAFPGSVSNVGNQAKRTIILPGNSWEKVTTIPDGYKLHNGYSDFLLVKGEMWIRVNKFDSPNTASPLEAIIAYNIKNHNWKISNSKEIPNILFADDSGSIFGLHYFAADKIITKYNFDTDEFDIIYPEANSNQSLSITQSRFQPTYDGSGNIWFNLVVKGGKSGLYKYDVNANRLTYSQPLALSNVDYYIFGPNRKLWLIGNSQESNDRVLYEMDPTSKEIKIKSYDVASDDFLYLDKDNNLWVSDKYWVKVSQSGDIDKSQYRIIRSPVFIISDGVPDDKYMWLRPSKMFQSSGGEYWFTSMAGTVELNKTSEEWCLFTNGSSKVVEDDEKSVWIVIDNTLYKKKL